jgi:hypothetical protein
MFAAESLSDAWCSIGAFNGMPERHAIELTSNFKKKS